MPLLAFRKELLSECNHPQYCLLRCISTQLPLHVLKLLWDQHCSCLGCYHSAECWRYNMCDVEYLRLCGLRASVQPKHATDICMRMNFALALVPQVCIMFICLLEEPDKLLCSGKHRSSSHTFRAIILNANTAFLVLSLKMYLILFFLLCSAKSAVGN